MRFLDILQQKIGFTRGEAIALLTFSAVVLGGSALRYFSPREQTQVIPVFDYSKIDSAYTAARLDSASPKPPSPPSPASLSAPHVAKRERLVPIKSVNLNAATKSQLMSLPGIGESYAWRIISFRESNGGFRTVDDLLKIKGIGEKKLEKLRPFVSVK